ncbi:TIGR01777 family protein [Segetibacter sp. 3557_3]|uniref:TIGR01777 family oxidoreductase n=1 Tax=Segetibacter sp. 3557_3 TaxID=2547429 RepID=UPI001058B142|nr:TIGR01777 family oxidoreductase [Segetibacter sp. 3557_3]TDH23352.1 TIGR01777 family protein [Segetibacter sp. 3557_3]
MSCILITGGTGLIGAALTKMLVAKGHEVIILSRSAKRPAENNVRFAAWDINAGIIDREAISQADVLVHLAGAGVANKRWTSSRKKEIVESRTKSSALLVKALTEIPNKITTVLSASAIGWYGTDERHKFTNKPFNEETPADTDFLGETCRLWEESINPVEKLGKRLVKLRTGIVLSNEGGAYAEFKKPIQFGIAGFLGSGKQVISWIHMEDMCRMYLYAMETNISGVFNAVAPMPVTNKELTFKLANKIRGKFFVPLHVPGFALRMLLGGMSVEVLKSATVSAEKIRVAGFHFLYPSIDAALDAL